MSGLPVDRPSNGPTSHAITRLDSIWGNSTNAQSIMAYLLFNIQNILIKAFEKISQAKNKSGLAAIQSGFNSAGQTQTAGSMLAAGGLALGAAGVAQGIGNFQQAKGIAEATETRTRALANLDDEVKAASNEMEQGLTVKVEELDETEKAALNEQDFTVKVEELDESCSAPSDIEDNVVLDAEGDILYDAQETLSNKQAKPRDQVEEVKDLKDTTKATEERKNKKIKLINKDYEIEADIVKAQSNKLQAAGTPGQAAYYVSQGLSEHQKAKSQKESLIQQVQQDNQNQQGNTADGVKREVDKISDFDPFQRNSASQR